MNDKSRIDEEYYENGVKQFSVEYKNDIVIQHKEWFENSQLSYEESFKDNIKESKLYFSNGQIATHSKMKTMEVMGVARQHILSANNWYEDGQIAKEEILGKKTIFYDKKGNEIVESDYFKLGHNRYLINLYGETIKYKNPQRTPPSSFKQ